MSNVNPFTMAQNQLDTAAEKLGLQTKPLMGVVHRQSNDFLGSRPGCTAGCPPDHLNIFYKVIIHSDVKLRCPELLTIPSKADLPCKGTSCRRCIDPVNIQLFAGGNYRDALFFRLIS